MQTRQALRLLNDGLVATTQVPDVLRAGQTLITDYFQEAALRLQENQGSLEGIMQLVGYPESFTRTETETQEEEGSSKKDMSTGYYKGPFKRVKKNIITSEDIFTSLGFYAVKEQFGKVTASDCVYAGLSGFDLTETSLVVTIAMLRKLFMKHGMDIPDATVSIIDNLAVSGFNMLILYTDSEGNFSNPGAYTFVNGETLGTLATNSGIKGSIENYAKASSDKIVNRIVLRAGETVLAQLVLKYESVVIEMEGKITLQNRTKGALASTSESDTVDNQPLKGYQYYFKKQNPRTKMEPTAADGDKWVEFNYGNLGGIKLISSGGSNIDPVMQEPPSPNFFQNCSKSSKVRLEPGSIKTGYVSNKITKNYEDFIRNLAWYNGGNVYRTQRIADTVLFAFEETLNSNSSNLITLTYETEQRCGAFFKTTGVPSIKKSYNNIGPIDVVPP